MKKKRSEVAEKEHLQCVKNDDKEKMAKKKRRERRIKTII